MKAEQRIWMLLIFLSAATFTLAQAQDSSTSSAGDAVQQLSSAKLSCLTVWQHQCEQFIGRKPILDGGDPPAGIRGSPAFVESISNLTRLRGWGVYF